MMHYERYFKPGQRLVLHCTDGSGSAGAALDCLVVQLVTCGETEFQVVLQDATVADDITPGTVFEILGDIFDFGLRLTAGLERALPDGRMFLKPQGGLEFFFRRRFLRAESCLWLGWQRGGALKTLRRQWKSWSVEPKKIPEKAQPRFSLQQVSLGAGGLGLHLPAPVSHGEVLLLFLALGDGKPLICAVAEVVWAEKPRTDGLQSAGLQFLNLLDIDRQRIELYVRRCLWMQKQESEG